MGLSIRLELIHEVQLFWLLGIFQFFVNHFLQLIEKLFHIVDSLSRRRSRVFIKNCKRSRERVLMLASRCPCCPENHFASGERESSGVAGWRPRTFLQSSNVAHGQSHQLLTPPAKVSSSCVAACTTGELDEAGPNDDLYSCERMESCEWKPV